MAESHPGPEFPRDQTHARVGLRRWPHGRRWVLPVTLAQRVEPMRDGTANLDRDVARPLTAGQPDRAQHPARFQQVTDTSQSGDCIYVMKRGHRRHEVEGGQLERIEKEVSAHVVDVVVRVLGFGEVDACLVEIDAHNVGHPLPKFAREHALTASNVERPHRSMRDGIEDQRIIVRVVVPSTGIRRHALIVSRTAIRGLRPR